MSIPCYAIIQIQLPIRRRTLPRAEYKCAGFHFLICLVFDPYKTRSLFRPLMHESFLCEGKRRSKYVSLIPERLHRFPSLLFFSHSQRLSLDGCKIHSFIRRAVTQSVQRSETEQWTKFWFCREYFVLKFTLSCQCHIIEEIWGG